MFNWNLLIDLIDTLPTKKSKELKNDIVELMELYATDQNLCPECLRELAVHIWGEERGECRGYISHEIVSEKICTNCGWKEGE